jgi:hypothetical protein
VDGISLWKEAGYRAEPTAWISGIEKRWKCEVRNRARHSELRRVMVEVWLKRRIA